eukprot:6650705-Pyramimonas_sp.AAC.1
MSYRWGLVQEILDGRCAAPCTSCIPASPKRMQVVSLFITLCFGDHMILVTPPDKRTRTHTHQTNPFLSCLTRASREKISLKGCPRLGQQAHPAAEQGGLRTCWR